MTSPGRICFTIFGFDVMWYGVLIGTGMVLGILLCYLRAPAYEINRDRMLDVLLISIPCGVIGARIYYVIFNWSYYGAHPGEILDIRGGGLAIHGGLIVGIGIGLLLCRRFHISYAGILDLIAPCLALGQAIGRWGNFFNSEAYGCETDLPWAIVVYGRHVHPTFLYESIWCFLIFIALMVLERRRRGKTFTGPGDDLRNQRASEVHLKSDLYYGLTSGNLKERGFPGEAFLLYGMLYSLERFFVEALRTDSLMIGPLRQAQLISLVIFIVCAGIYIYKKKETRRRFS